MPGVFRAGLSLEKAMKEKDIPIVYFVPLPKTLEELKKAYYVLARRFHPDLSGDVETMKAINAEYDYLFSVDNLKNTYRNKDGKTYTSTKPNDELPEAFREIIVTLLKLDGIIVEICGLFIWITGNTHQHKDTLKKMGFKFSGKKVAWYLAPDGYRRRWYKEDYSLDDIRSMYGCKRFYKNEEGQKQTTLSTLGVSHAM